MVKYCIAIYMSLGFFLRGCRNNFPSKLKDECRKHILQFKYVIPYYPGQFCGVLWQSGFPSTLCRAARCRPRAAPAAVALSWRGTGARLQRMRALWPGTGRGTHPAAQSRTQLRLSLALCRATSSPVGAHNMFCSGGRGKYIYYVYFYIKSSQ